MRPVELFNALYTKNVSVLVMGLRINSGKCCGKTLYIPLFPLTVLCVCVCVFLGMSASFLPHVLLD